MFSDEGLLEKTEDSAPHPMANRGASFKPNIRSSFYHIEGGFLLKQKYENFIVILLTVVLLLSVGCTKDSPAIKATQLTENEKELLRSVGVERYFVFDVDLSHIVFQRLEYRVDYYEKGKFVKHLIHGATSGLSAKKGIQRLIWSQIKTGSNHDEIWMIGFDGSRMTQKVTLSKRIRGMSWSQNEMISTVNLGEEVMLAAIVGTDSGNIQGSGIIFDKDEGGIKALEYYDVVYLLTVVFHEDLST